VPDIPFTDNANTLRLIDGAPGEPGIFQLLSEECVLGNTSDSAFLARVAQRYEKAPAFARPAANRAGAFAIRHFAAEVTYDVVGFIAKNKDPLPIDLAMLLKFSTDGLVRALFNPPADDDADAPAAGAAAHGKAAPVRFKAAKFVGVIDGFRTSLADLVHTLEGTHTHFVRCIKPNLRKAADSYDRETAVRQLRTSGVVQAVYAARAGFPDHLPFDTLAHSFALLAPGYKPGGAVLGGRAGAEAALRAAGVEPSRYRLGTSLAFLQVGALDALEAGRSAALAHRAVFLQARIRTCLARKLIRQMRDEKAREAAARERERLALANQHAAEEEARRVAAEAERQRAEAEAAAALEEEAGKKQAKFNIARQKSFERAAARKQRDDDGGTDPAAAAAADAVSALPMPKGPPKAVVTDEAMAQQAAAEYGFTNPVADVLEYAQYLGMDVSKDGALLWIADEALSAPEPHGARARATPRACPCLCASRARCDATPRRAIRARRPLAARAPAAP
jgi:myosin heavy subunit